MFNPADFLNTILTSDAFASLLLTAVAGAASALAGAVIYYVRKRVLKDLDSAELAQLREIAALAVQFAEQKFKDAGGDVKLAEAMKAADAMLASYGIKVTTRQLQTVIEAAVYTALAKDEPAPAEIVVPGDTPTEADTHGS
jgi:LL-H family phage holin